MFRAATHVSTYVAAILRRQLLNEGQLSGTMMGVEAGALRVKLGPYPHFSTGWFNWTLVASAIWRIGIPP